jgi:hypothetical protein
VTLLYGALALLGGIAGLAMLVGPLPEPAQCGLPLVVIVMAALLTASIEMRCARVGLTPTGTPDHPPSNPPSQS